MTKTREKRRSALRIRRKPGYRRIATEEAWAPTEMLELYMKLMAKRSFDEPGFRSLMGFYLQSPSERARQVAERLQWLDERRIRDMDDSGIDMQVLALTAPGVQIFDRATAVSIAKSSNDQLAEAVRTWPDRFTGLAAVAPQDPPAAAKELERAVLKLGLKGAVINSHTHGEYLDDDKFWDILEAAEALNVPIYLHPRDLPRTMLQPFVERGLDGAIYGFGCETGLHMLRIIVSGALDRFPKLRFIIGHGGEALPYWMYRVDYMHAAAVRSKRFASAKPLKKRPGDYLKENIYITTSGMAWAPAIMFAQSVLGVDRVLYAMDYPYQFTPAEVAAMDAMPISARAKKMFFQSNAERVFNL
ncbi:MAG: amidohydrolase [Gammaproteobacteria bacterium]|nr:amidohydrolase [Gammaproteobacteria bacterium]